MKELRITLPQPLYDELSSCARRCSQPVTAFVKEIVEADIAARRLQSMPPCPKKPGGPPDLLARLNLK